MIQGLKAMDYSFLSYGEMIEVEGGEVSEHEDRKEKQQLLPQN
jgi:hypothetical protein